MNDWVCRKIGDTTTTGQVVPGAFTRTIAKAAEEKGVEIIIATVTEVVDKENGTKLIVAVDKEGHAVNFEDVTDVVFAAGPWTGRLAKQLLGEKAGVAVHIVPRCVRSFVRPCSLRGD